MDLDYIRKNAARFAYELRKNFPDDESPINHYMCDKGLIVLSTKKLYVFYYEGFIDYKGDLLSNVEVEFNNDDIVKFTLKKKEFHLKLPGNQEYRNFEHYYNKYKD